MLLQLLRSHVIIIWYYICALIICEESNSFNFSLMQISSRKKGIFQTQPPMLDYFTAGVCNSPSTHWIPVIIITSDMLMPVYPALSLWLIVPGAGQVSVDPNLWGIEPKGNGLLFDCFFCLLRTHFALECERLDLISSIQQDKESAGMLAALWGAWS